MSRSFLFNLLAIVIFAVGAVLFFQNQSQINSPAPTPLAETSATAAIAAPLPASTTPAAPAVSVSATSTPPTHLQKNPPKKLQNKAISQPVASSTSQVARLQNPYAFGPMSFDVINTDARAALVNILCEPRGGSLLPISGSGVIIDPRGVILTNAHVAQYVLLSESSKIDLSCTIRTKAPAQATWQAQVLYIPTVWISEHAEEILASRATGTGEHDYALLYITGSVNGDPLPNLFPFLQFDTRDALHLPGDPVLAAAYPAEFVGGIIAQNGLYSVSSVTSIKQLYTFASGSVDLYSLGGIIEAQSGSSGGAVVNAWDRLVGLITTTSDAKTTAGRDLHAITLSYISRDMDAQIGTNLQELLNNDPAILTKTFSSTAAPLLIQKYVDILAAHGR